MHIRSVTAEAFGPLVNETLVLSPGLTVVHGDNESAKSSWHAAIYAALCGRRRGKGATRLEDREFADRRRPWDRNSWQVRCELTLDDGRAVTLRHDLDGKVDCCALDARGRDLSSEIMYDGAPDGSRWLGLNRRTYAATACVDQAQLLQVLIAADELQTDIQRAAATAGRDETAAAALIAVKDFRKTSVGKDTVNSRRPLRRASQELARATAACDEAQQAHADYLRLVSAAESAQQAAAAAAAERRRAEVAAAAAERLLRAVQELTTASSTAAQTRAIAEAKRARADASQSRRARAAALAAGLPDTEPTSGSDDDAVAQRVSSALGRWRSVPPEHQLAGVSSHDLQRRISALPDRPVGDLVVDPAVKRLSESLQSAERLVERADRRRPPASDASDPLVAAAARIDPSTLRLLADRLTDPVAAVDESLMAELDATARFRDEARSAAEAAERQETAGFAAAQQAGVSSPEERRPQSSVTALATLIGAALLAAGLVLLVLGHPAPGALFAAGGFGAVAAGGVLRRSRGRVASTPAHHAPSGEAGAGVTGVDAQLAGARRQLRDCREASLRAEHAYLLAAAKVDAAQSDASVSAVSRQSAAEEAEALGVPADASRLRSLATEARRFVSEREAFERWHSEYAAERSALRAAQDSLATALRDKGYGECADVRDAYVAYERDCATRTEKAQTADRRGELTGRLHLRLEAERAAEQAQRARSTSVQELVAAARSAGVLPSAEPGDPADGSSPTTAAPAEVADRLSDWLGTRGGLLVCADERRRQWQELQTLLDGRSLEELDAMVAADVRSVELAAQADRAATFEVETKTDDVETAASEAAATQATVDAIADAAAAHQMELPHLSNEQAALTLATRRRTSLDLALSSESLLAREASSQQGKVIERERAVPNVAEAEESLDRARVELERVLALDSVLDLTESFLKEAQETTYTNLAPVLASALERWLPEVTGGRYRRALVDPETLAVRVESAAGAWRRAELLSVGTSEQIYLLLRVALAEHLASKSTVSPLLLDDVTVQADPSRTQAILRMCKALADDGRQVVLFAQEPSVATWAEAHLDGITHTLIRLPPPLAA